MKKLIATTGALLLAIGLPQFARANPITPGSVIEFGGTATLDTNDADTATEVLSFNGTTVVGDTGVFNTVAPAGTAATFSATPTTPWTFNSGPVADFWTVSTNAGSFTFNLTESAIVTQGNGEVYVTGTGCIISSSNLGFSPTLGTWSFTTQNPGLGDSGVFSFSSSGITVPDGGTTALLVGVGLVAMGLMIRRKVAA